MIAPLEGRLEERRRTLPWQRLLFWLAVAGAAGWELHMASDRDFGSRELVLSVALVLAVAVGCYRLGRRDGRRDGEAIGALVGYLRSREDAGEFDPLALLPERAFESDWR